MSIWRTANRRALQGVGKFVQHLVYNTWKVPSTGVQPVGKFCQQLVHTRTLSIFTSHFQSITYWQIDLEKVLLD
jgi:hypothetical protein